jgi:hypothetical protein
MELLIGKLHAIREHFVEIVSRDKSHKYLIDTILKARPKHIKVSSIMMFLNEKFKNHPFSKEH